MQGHVSFTFTQCVYVYVKYLKCIQCNIYFMYKIIKKNHVYFGALDVLVFESLCELNNFK